MFSTFLLYFILGSIVVLLFYICKLLIDLVSSFNAFIHVMFRILQQYNSADLIEL